MATTTNLLQHPTHDHPLVPRDFSNDSVSPFCHLCRRRILSDGYDCQERCKSYYYHRVCAEVPPQIDHHPLHPQHPLTLFHHVRSVNCDACGENVHSSCCMFNCQECNFDLEVSCALSTLSDRGDFRLGKIPERITLPIHHHMLISFSTRHDFIQDVSCVICREHVVGDGYMCLRHWCKFLIHKRCIQDLYYADGTKAPQVFRNHRLQTFVAEDTGSRRCVNWGPEHALGEFIGCASCQVFIHRNCIQVPEILKYPPHPDHTLVLFLNRSNCHELQCRSCFGYVEGELCYHCTSCNFFVHIQCALNTLDYCKEGTSLKCKSTWHEHPLLLCHITESVSSRCFVCDDESSGPMYACEEQACGGFFLHPKCSSFNETKIHPHHPEHELTFCIRDGGPSPLCEACRGEIFSYGFSCRRCEFYLHPGCAERAPTLKHYLHEHELLRLDKAPSLDCNHCGGSTDSPFFRCILCNFNLHEKCMELPRVMKSEIHWHPLTLHEQYIEDDSGDYYCDRCEKRRDVHLGAYVCLECTARWAYHMERVLPELQKVYENVCNPVIERLAKEIARKEEEAGATEKRLEKIKLELDELRKKHAELVLEEGKNQSSAC